ncbi:MAG: hypothetical protein ACFBZ8_09430 [Opitutales bacterium]
MLSFKSLSLLVCLGLFALFNTGCTSFTAGEDYRYRSGEMNIAGIVKYQKNAYEPIPLDGGSIRTSELYPRYNPSGDQISLLWGFLTIADY